MKKVMTGLLVMGFLAGGTLAQTAQGRTMYNLNAGVLGATGWTVPFFTLGFGLDIPMGKQWTVSPEVQMIGYFVNFRFVVLTPSVLVDFSPQGNFFVGAGLTLPILATCEESDTGLCSAANVGYRGRHFLIAGYLATPFREMLSYNIFGARVGYRF
jgi:hypothetical protein